MQQAVADSHHKVAARPAHALEDVTVEYRGGATALDRVSLSLVRGEQVAIIGPSGAGKTTLLHTLGCAVRPMRGTLRVLDVQPWTLAPAALHRLRRELFIAPQAPPLPPRQRVVNAVLAGRLPRWTLWEALRSLVLAREAPLAAAALARLDVQDKLFLRCDRLSGGERQRVGLARALVSDARLMLLDEPVSMLDPALALSALETLQAEARDRNATLVVSLHAVDLALARFSRLIGMRDGRVLFDLPRSAVDGRLLEQLYGRELGTSLQEAAIVDVATLKLPNCR